LRFELLSEGRTIQRGRRREQPRGEVKAQPHAQGGAHHPGRSPRKKDRKPGKAKAGKSKRGKPF
jgi:ribonuclease R